MKESDGNNITYNNENISVSKRKILLISSRYILKEFEVRKGRKVVRGRTLRKEWGNRPKQNYCTCGCMGHGCRGEE